MVQDYLLQDFEQAARLKVFLLRAREQRPGQFVKTRTQYKFSASSVDIEQLPIAASLETGLAMIL